MYAIVRDGREGRNHTPGGYAFRPSCLVLANSLPTIAYSQRRACQARRGSRALPTPGNRLTTQKRRDRTAFNARSPDGVKDWTGGIRAPGHAPGEPGRRQEMNMPTRTKGANQTPAQLNQVSSAAATR